MRRLAPLAALLALTGCAAPPTTPAPGPAVVRVADEAGVQVLLAQGRSVLSAASGVAKPSQLAELAIALEALETADPTTPEAVRRTEDAIEAVRAGVADYVSNAERHAQG